MDNIQCNLYYDFQHYFILKKINTFRLLLKKTILVQFKIQIFGFQESGFHLGSNLDHNLG